MIPTDSCRTLALLTTAQSPGCVQYLPTSPTPPLQCSTHLIPCHYVTTPSSLSLQATEQQLERLLGQIQPALTNGELRRRCLDGFLFLYCLQVYGICGQEVGGAFESSGRAVVCEGDCIEVITEDCRVQEWGYLTNIVAQLRTAAVLELPSLMGLTECANTTTTGRGACLTRSQQGMS